MSTIGTFTKTDTDFAGTLKTLTLNVKMSIRHVEKSNEKAPDFRVYAGAVEFGAGWKKTSQADRNYISVKLDDPSFPAPIFANLVPDEGSDTNYSLIWSRRD